MLPPDLEKRLLKAQENEFTEHIIYRKLAAVVKSKEAGEILAKISREEQDHYEFFKSITRKDSRPNRVKVLVYVWLARVFGLNFGLKLMENGEDLAQDVYGGLQEVSPEIEKIVRDENEHELELIDLINEERLKYISSIVLGLNDALVELTGALAGFTLAIQRARVIGAVGLITGVAASLSMSASEYLSTKQEGTEKNPLKASIYTGLAYVATVLFLIFPYFLLNGVFACLGLVIFNALLVILVFTFYVSVAKNLAFRKRFLEMAGLSLSIAAISFFIGSVIRKVFGVEI